MTIIASNNAVKIRFQLTHPWGCDTCVWFSNLFRYGFQLTHPWGCDYKKLYEYAVTGGFQLTHPWGCDWLVDISTKSWKFQLTHPWGCDLPPCYCTGVQGDFNSHTREGVTEEGHYLSYSPLISTHTPVRVWLFACKSLFSFFLFQLTHPWGCDNFGKSWNAHSEWFQLTHPWGCDYLLYCIVYKTYISTHTPVRVWR